VTSHCTYPYHAHLENGDILISELPVAVVVHCISGVRCAFWRTHVRLISSKYIFQIQDISNDTASSGCILYAW